MTRRQKKNSWTWLKIIVKRVNQRRHVLWTDAEPVSLLWDWNFFTAKPILCLHNSLLLAVSKLTDFSISGIRSSLGKSGRRGTVLLNLVAFLHTNFDELEATLTWQTGDTLDINRNIFLDELSADLVEATEQPPSNKRQSWPVCLPSVTSYKHFVCKLLMHVLRVRASRDQHFCLNTHQIEPYTCI